VRIANALLRVEDVRNLESDRASAKPRMLGDEVEPLAEIREQAEIECRERREAQVVAVGALHVRSALPVGRQEGAQPIVEIARTAFDLVLIAYLQVGADLRGRVLAGAAAALVPGGTLLVVGHDLTNLTEGVGGPTSPHVLYTPEAITAGLPALRILRAERVRRTVERDGGQATAVDTLVRAERPAG